MNPEAEFTISFATAVTQITLFLSFYFIDKKKIISSFLLL